MPVTVVVGGDVGGVIVVGVVIVVFVMLMLPLICWVYRNREMLIVCVREGERENVVVSQKKNCETTTR